MGKEFVKRFAVVFTAIAVMMCFTIGESFAAVSPAKVPSSKTVKTTLVKKTTKKSTLKKKNLYVKGAIKISKKPKGAKVTYKRLSGSSKYLTINSKTGVITVKKHKRCKSKYHSIKVRVTVKNYGKSYSKTVKIKIYMR